MAGEAGAEKDELRALFGVIEGRRAQLAASSPEEREQFVKESWTAKLLNKGVEKCAQKVGEEATECVIEAVQGRKEGLVKESADLLYHLAVTWAAVGVTPDDVYAEIRKRHGVSGIAEKASRKE
eukprot:TRINITY_DN28286_c0_g1_i1.p2 TRINITY_DN28286_c0_g1~~TRINITY_DN28286_c0_g1_i1.p2  ORF type:complete len:141 (+),score=59.19 TRINITY_DN28286_c0_g1_i1:52-423(+)